MSALPAPSQVPFFRLFIPFVIGIFLSYTRLFHLPFFVPLVFFLVLVARLQMRVIRRLDVSFLIVFSFLSLGYYIGYEHDERSKTDFFGNKANQITYIIGRVVSSEKAGKWQKTGITVLQVIDSTNQKMPSSGNFLAFLGGETSTHYGDILLLKTEPTLIAGITNPSQFNYQEYQHFRNVHFQDYVDSSDWAVLDTLNRPALMSFVSVLRKLAFDALIKYAPTENEQGVIGALVLGQNTELNDETIRAYAQTGALHVLSVSGLHVGIVVMLLNFIFKAIRWKHPLWKGARPALIIAAIWFYAVLTGASPSVLRAAAMFSFVTIGLYVNRPASIYNALSVAAFFILCFDPFMLMNVGFQLSFIAVVGIVYFQPKIYSLFFIQHKLLDYFWQLTSVSIAAQLATFPLGIFYFHQFPWLFWLSGLIVIPTSTVILGVGLLLLVVGWSGVIAQTLGWLLWQTTRLTNAVIFGLQGLPNSATEGIWIDEWQLLAIFVAIFGLIVLLEYSHRKFQGVLLLLIGTVVVFGIEAKKKVERQHQQELVIYHGYKQRVIGCLSGELATVLYDTATISLHRLEYIVQSHLDASCIKSIDFQDLKKNNRGLNWFWNKNGVGGLGSCTFVVVDDPKDIVALAGSVAEVVLVSGSPKIKMKDLSEKVAFKHLVFDGSNKYWKVDEWVKDCDSLGISYHNTAEKGAFVYDVDKKETKNWKKIKTYLESKLLSNNRNL